MKVVMAMVGAAAMLAACGPAKPKYSEQELATRIVDAGGVLSIDGETLEQVIGNQIRSVAFEHPDMTPEQQVKLSTAIRTQMETALPELKKQMAGFLVESFEPAELQSYHDFVAAKEQTKIKETMPSVMQMSLAAADAMTMKAVDEALKAEGLKTDPAPGEGHGAPGAAPAAPAATPAPAKPAPAKPAKPN